VPLYLEKGRGWGGQIDWGREGGSTERIEWRFHSTESPEGVEPHSRHPNAGTRRAWILTSCTVLVQPWSLTAWCARLVSLQILSQPGRATALHTRERRAAPQGVPQSVRARMTEALSTLAPRRASCLGMESTFNFGCHQPDCGGHTCASARGGALCIARHAHLASSSIVVSH
jgi:hypothetical protein